MLEKSIHSHGVDLQILTFRTKRNLFSEREKEDDCNIPFLCFEILKKKEEEEKTRINPMK